MAWIASISPVDKVVALLRKVLFFLFVLQMILVVQRLVFDFLGYMWLMIAANFINFAFLLFGLYGVQQLQPKYLFAYLIWKTIWICFNLLVILLYLNVMSVTHKNDWLSLKQGHQSWFKNHGIGCGPDLQKMGYDSVKGCAMKFEHVEVIQATIQMVVSVISFGLSSWLLRRHKDRTEEEFGFIGDFDPHTAYIPPSKSSKMAAPRYV